MRKIIFDLDNTLMMFDIEYIKSYQTALRENNFESEYINGYNLFNSIGRYEEQQNVYNKVELLNFVNKDLNENYTLKLIDDLLLVIGKYWTNPVSLGLIDTLEYLKSKYELYVLTNWFTESQKERLKNVGILKYFKCVVGSDMVKPKPSFEAFKYIIDNNNPKDFIMIGDNIETDIKGALEVSMNAILFDYDDKYSDTNYIRITKIEELKDIL